MALRYKRILLIVWNTYCLLIVGGYSGCFTHLPASDTVLGRNANGLRYKIWLRPIS